MSAASLAAAGGYGSATPETGTSGVGPRDHLITHPLGIGLVLVALAPVGRDDLTVVRGQLPCPSPVGSLVSQLRCHLCSSSLTALAQMELEIKRERITDSVSKRRAAGKDLGGRRQAFTDSQVKNAARLIDAGESSAQVARDMGMSRATLYRRLRAIERAEAIAAASN